MDYLKKILPIPITDTKISDNGYKITITTYASVLQEYGIENLINKIMKQNKRIQYFDGWYFEPQNVFYKQAIVSFKRGEK